MTTGSAIFGWNPPRDAGKSVVQCCKTCRFLKVPPDRDGKVRYRSSQAYACTFNPPEPVLPVSILRHGFRWPPARGYMDLDEGTDCKTWEPRE